MVIFKNRINLFRECMHSLFQYMLYLKCSYFQTPSSCDSGIVSIASIFDGSFLISCCIYCCTANVLSITSNGSSGQRQKSFRSWNVQNEKRKKSFQPKFQQLITKEFIPLRWIQWCDWYNFMTILFRVQNFERFLNVSMTDLDMPAITSANDLWKHDYLFHWNEIVVSIHTTADMGEPFWYIGIWNRV